MGDGQEGGGRWYDHHHRTLVKIRQLIATLEDPKIPIGTVMRSAVDSAQMRQNVLESAKQDWQTAKDEITEIE